PALNEQDTLKHVVEWTASVLGGVADDFEIIIVDDGSTDETGRIADALAAQSCSIKVIHNPRPSGYGGAREAGFRIAGNGGVGLITADGAFYTTHFARLASSRREAH